MEERNSLLTSQMKGEHKKTREEMQGGRESTEQKRETLGPGENSKSLGNGPVTRPLGPLKEVVGLLILRSPLPCCLIKLRFCS